MQILKFKYLQSEFEKVGYSGHCEGSMMQCILYPWCVLCGEAFYNFK